MSAGLFTAVTTTLVLIVPPLSEAEYRQLETAGDFNPLIDAGPLYPLLHNALKWRAFDESGALIPDYAAIRRLPASYRGNLFLIEGRLAGNPRPIARLARPGDWQGRLQQWSILVQTDPDEVVVVYLVSPPIPSSGQGVRLPARFYKIWADFDQDHQPTNYLVFVGHGAKVIGDHAGQSSGPVTFIVFLAIVVLMAVGYFLLRAKTQPRSWRTGDRRSSRKQDNGPDMRDEELSLPKDPAAALDDLDRRHTAEVEDRQ